MGKKKYSMLVKREVFVCKDQFTVAFQQNIINHISLFWGKPTFWLCVGDILSER